MRRKVGARVVADLLAHLAAVGDHLHLLLQLLLTRAGLGALPSRAVRGADPVFLLGPHCKSGFPLLPTEAQGPAQGDALTKAAPPTLVPPVSLACHSGVLVPRQPSRPRRTSSLDFELNEQRSI